MSDALKVKADLSAARARITKIERLWRELGEALGGQFSGPYGDDAATGNPVQEAARWARLWQELSPDTHGALAFTCRNGKWTVWRLHTRCVEAAEEALKRVIAEAA